MKVLHLIGGGDVGGAKIHVLSLVKELSKYIDVKIISFRHGVFADEAREMGINIEVVKTGNIFSDVRRVVDALKKEEYDIIHSHGSKGNMMSVLARFSVDLPSVTTVHSDYRLDYLQSLPKMLSFGLINKVSLRLIDYYIGVSNSFKDMLIARKFNARNIFTVYNGVDFNNTMPNCSRAEFAKKHSLKLNDDDILVGILARLHPVKGISTFIKAAAEVIKHNPSVKFLIGGDGEERKSLERKVSSLGISDKVLFLGFVNEPYEFMSCMDINTLTSLSESFPYVILEGARLKKPTVCSNVGGLSDLIESGKNGYMFTPGDHKTLANYILELANNAQMRLQMGERLYQKAFTHFSLESMCKTQLDIYDKIIAESSTQIKSRKYYDAVISGYYGFKNSGDDAILMAIINNLRMYKEDIKTIILSKTPVETGQNYKELSVNRYNPIQILYAMHKSKLFISGGGNLIQDTTSSRSILYYLSMIWIAKKLGLKVMLYANGIGPIKRNFNRILTKRVLSNVDVITLREEKSLKELQSLGVNTPKITLTADPALTLEPAEESLVDEILSNEGVDANGSFVGFSVRKWQDWEMYADIIAQGADHMIKSYGVKPLFIPMQHTKDLPIINNIVSKMKGKGYVISGKYDVPQVLGIIKRMKLMIGMRLHALVYAASLQVPVIGLVYESKVEGFLKYINQASAGHVRQLDIEHFKSVIDNVWNTRERIKAEMQEVTQGLKEKALLNAKIAVELIEEIEKR